MAAYSLRTRLLFWLLIPLVVIGLIALFDAYRSARDIADKISDRVLSGSALAIAERVFVNDEGKLDVDIPYVALEMLTSAEDDRVFYKIEGAEGEFITGYRELGVPNLQTDSTNTISFSDFEFRGFPIRIAVLNGAASSSTTSLDYRLAIAETTNARNKMARDILLRSAVRQGLLIITAAITVWFAVTRALLPLYKVRDAIGRRGSDDLRPIKHHVPNEISGLVSTTNDLLSRIGANIAALKNFTTNASHQLRTPLTVMHTHVEIAKRSNDKQQRNHALDQVDEAVKDAEKVVSRLLTLATIDSVSLTNLRNRKCDIANNCKSVCADYISSSNFENVDLGYEGEDSLIIKGDEVLYREMIKNLIDNSLKYGGDNLHITVRCLVRKNSVLIEVEDNGIGLTDIQKTNLAKRFSRGPNAQAGHGLGLPIAREIAELFGGNIMLKDGTGNQGLLVQIELPKL